MYLFKHLKELSGMDEAKENTVFFCGLFYNAVNTAPLLLFCI